MVGESRGPWSASVVTAEGVVVDGRPGRGVRRAEANSSVSSAEGVLGSSREEEKVGKLDRRNGGDLVLVVEEEDIELMESLGRPTHPSREPPSRVTLDVELSSLSFPLPFASPPAHHFPIPERVPSTTPAPVPL